jgi:hypothetical protein
LFGINSVITLKDCCFINLFELVFEEIHPSAKVEIINSYIEVRQALVNMGYWIFPTVARTQPLVIFRGHNTVYCINTPANYIYCNPAQTNRYIEKIGTLVTNGVLQSGTTQNNIL